jgi:hypothetical protein
VGLGGMIDMTKATTSTLCMQGATWERAKRRWGHLWVGSWLGTVPPEPARRRQKTHSTVRREGGICIYLGTEFENIKPVVSCIDEILNAVLCPRSVDAFRGSCFTPEHSAPPGPLLIPRDSNSHTSRLKLLPWHGGVNVLFLNLN